MPPKIVVIVGPTSSGKSDLAVALARRFNGEVVSCDSRQIYRGMDLGTGKVAGKWKALAFSSHPERVHPSEGSLNHNKRQYFVYKNVIHHCIDYVNPKKQYSVVVFQKDARAAIADILSRSKLPILCGGTAHWVDAVVYDQLIPDVPPNAKLRTYLENKSTEKLFQQLQKMDPVRAKNIDRHNRRRLIRALEIVTATKGLVPPVGAVATALYRTLWLGLNPGQPLLYKKIDQRLKQRLKQGLVKEVERLHLRVPFSPTGGDVPPQAGQRGKRGLSWKRLMNFGLEYKFVSLYLQKKISYDEMSTQLSFAIKHFSKRQMTWWKKNKDINWIKNEKQAVKLLAEITKSSAKGGSAFGGK